MKKSFLLLASVIISQIAIAQVFISNKQSHSSSDSEKEYFQKKKVTISDDNFVAELPNGQVLKGVIILTSDEIKDGKKVKIYKTDKNCVLVLNEDYIFLNLYRTDNIAYTFYLDNYVEPTEADKKITQEKTKYELNVKFYGKFTADCIKEGKVKPGMDGVAALLLLGTPNTINKTETAESISEQLVYDNMYVYLKNGIVEAIQTRLEIK